MKEVFIVYILHADGSSDLRSVFSTEEKATNYIDEQQSQNLFELHLETFPLDEGVEENDSLPYSLTTVNLAYILHADGGIDIQAIFSTKPKAHTYIKETQKSSSFPLEVEELLVDMPYDITVGTAVKIEGVYVLRGVEGTVTRFGGNELAFIEIINDNVKREIGVLMKNLIPIKNI